MPDTLKPDADELSTYAIQARMYDEDDVSVIPTTLTWTLRDIAGTVVNSRLNVSIASPDVVNNIILSGADLNIASYFSNRRVLTLAGYYDSDLGTGLPTNQSVVFDINRLAGSIFARRTLTDMIQRLTPYFSDTKMEKVPPALRVKFLNEAQDEVVPMLKPNHLHELDTVLIGQVLDANGAFDLASLINPILQGTDYLEGVRTANGVFAGLISFYEFKSNQGYNRSPATRDVPSYRYEGTRIVLDPFTAGDLIGLYYKRIPCDMELGASEYLNVNCELDNDVQTIIVECAAKYGHLEVTGDMKAAEVCRVNALNMIAGLNQTAPQTDSTAGKYQNERYDTFGSMFSSINGVPYGSEDMIL